MEKNKRVQSLKHVKEEDWSYETDDQHFIKESSEQSHDHHVFSRSKLLPRAMSSDNFGREISVASLTIPKHDLESMTQTFSHNLSVEHLPLSNNLLEGGTYAIYVKELLQAASIRTKAHLKTNVSSTMKISQENEIISCFQDANYIRACLADAYSTNQPKSQLLVLYGKASMKESTCRSNYASTVMLQAEFDSKQHNSVLLCEDWKQRIECDIHVVEELHRVKQTPSLNSTMDLRTKNAFDLNRARAVLKADQKALAKAWSLEAKEHHLKTNHATQQNNKHNKDIPTTKLTPNEQSSSSSSSFSSSCTTSKTSSNTTSNTTSFSSENHEISDGFSSSDSDLEK